MGIPMGELPPEVQRRIKGRKAGKPHKYNVSAAKDRTWNGRTYDSKAEMAYAQHTWPRIGFDLVDVVEQPRVTLGCPENVYRPDFLIIPDVTEGNVAALSRDAFYVDVKGTETQQFKRNKKLWKRYGRLPLVIVKRKGDQFITTEIITPGGE